MMNLHGYKTLVFDCDGVLLDSNVIKTEAFHAIALRYGVQAADSLVNYHVANGGVSRYRKFEYLLGDILGSTFAPRHVQQLAEEYGGLVYERLMRCAVAPGLESLRQQLSEAAWMVVSGGAEAELRMVFSQRGLASLFDAGIHGSPATKDEILARLSADGTLASPAIFLGDSRYDHQAATRAGLAFVFVYGWTEFTQWRAYCDGHRVPAVRALQDFLSTGGSTLSRSTMAESVIPGST